MALFYRICLLALALSAAVTCSRDERSRRGHAPNDPAGENDADNERDDLLPDDDSGGEPTDADAPPPEEQLFLVDECKGDAGSEACAWRYRYNKDKCSIDNPCSKLLLFFSGGEMSCDGDLDSTVGYGKVLKAYADDGYLAICAGIYIGDVESGAVPYNDEASRVKKIISSIRASSAVKSLWDGKHLLFSGISHGSTAPVIAMARGSDDDADEWQGSGETAACFFDGAYDVVATNNFAINHSCAFVDRICPRYMGTTTGCVLDPNHPEVVADSITGIAPSALKIKNWKLVECGSSYVGALACNFDFLPAPPIQALCSAIDAGTDHTCAFDSQPTGTHLGCFSTDLGIDQCKAWFNGAAN